MIKLKFYTICCCIAFLLIIILFADYLSPFDPYQQNLAIALQSPNNLHLLGTDRYGRDIVSRILVGGQSTIFSALFIVFCSSIFGSFLGMICGYFGKTIDNLLMRFTDTFLAFPGIVFAIAFVGILGSGISNTIIALILISWPKFALLARSQTLQIKTLPFIKASIISGSSSMKIILTHILPNIFPTLIVTTMLSISTIIMEIAGLSFLGLGAMPPSAEWGAMMNNGRNYLQTAPHVIFAPGIAIFITVILFNLLADTLNELLNPKNIH